MKNALLVHTSNSNLEIDKVAKYYLFIKWLKLHYNAFYLLYAMQITIPDDDLQIRISMDYISPEDKSKVQAIVKEFNVLIFD